jgi:hypothetical protein
MKTLSNSPALPGTPHSSPVARALRVVEAGRTTVRSQPPSPASGSTSAHTGGRQLAEAFFSAHPSNPLFANQEVP